MDAERVRNDTTRCHPPIRNLTSVQLWRFGGDTESREAGDPTHRLLFSTPADIPCSPSAVTWCQELGTLRRILI